MSKTHRKQEISAYLVWGSNSNTLSNNGIAATVLALHTMVLHKVWEHPFPYLWISPCFLNGSYRIYSSYLGLTCIDAEHNPNHLQNRGYIVIPKLSFLPILSNKISVSKHFMASEYMELLGWDLLCPWNANINPSMVASEPEHLSAWLVLHG